MIKFSVKIEKSDTMKNLMKDVSSDYITLLINRNNLYLMYKSPEVYIHKRLFILEAIGMNKDTSMIIRILKKEFLTLLCDGIVTFTLTQEATSSKLNIEFFDDLGGLLYSLKVPYQEDIIDVYLEFIEMFNDYKSYPTIPIDEMGDLVKIGKALNTSISSGNSVTSVNAKGVFIFKEHSSSPFTIQAKTLDLLRKVAKEVHNVQNYLVYVNNDTCVAIRKSKYEEMRDFEYVVNAKSSHKITFKCNKMLTLIKKLKLDEGRFLLDFDNSKVIFKAEGKEFVTSINILESVSAKSKKRTENEQEFTFDINATGSLNTARNINMIELPATVLKGVLNNISVNETIIMYIKKSFIVLKINGVVVAFRKVDTHE